MRRSSLFFLRLAYLKGQNIRKKLRDAPKIAHQEIRELRQGLGLKTIRRPRPRSEDRILHEKHLKEVFGTPNTVDFTVMGLLDNSSPLANQDAVPDQDEIMEAVTKLKLGKACGTDGISGEELKVLMEIDEVRETYCKLITDFWNDPKTRPKAWLESRLVLIPKGGDAKKPKNWRPLAMVQTTVKVISSIISKRLNKEMERTHKNRETQNGFRQSRSVADSVCAAKTVIFRRKEYNKETWALFLDIVKAFDRVNRKLLWSILRKYGVPKKIVDIIKALYTSSYLVLEFDEDDITIQSESGVKQGDNLSPTLFNIVLQAAMESVEWPDACAPITFMTAPDGVTCSRLKSRTNQTEIAIRDFLYADDSAFMFKSRHALEIGTNVLVHHLARFGLRVHYALEDDGTLESKSIAMRFPTRTSQDTDYPALEEPLEISNATLGHSGEIVLPHGKIPFTNEFKYLGTWFNTFLDDETDIRRRIQAGSHAYNQLRPILQSPSLPQTLKGFLYSAYMVPVLTWGAEHWTGTGKGLKRLVSFHHSCLRSTLGISRAKQHAHHIRNSAIMSRLMVPEITAYADKRTLTWLGKIGRMDDSRLPRQLLFSWLDEPRKRGPSQTHFGIRARNLLVDMITTCVPANARHEFHGQTEFNRSEFKKNNISMFWKDFNNWITVAQDELKWKLYVDEYTQMHNYPSTDSVNSRMRQMPIFFIYVLFLFFLVLLSFFLLPTTRSVLFSF